MARLVGAEREDLGRAQDNSGHSPEGEQEEILSSDRGMGSPTGEEDVRTRGMHRKCTDLIDHQESGKQLRSEDIWYPLEKEQDVSMMRTGQTHVRWLWR
ncbi:hypothetical protein NDU88_007475 [Pleurodeles waltl]|uniref:Uncharacterized protein n=1 Tax=Pleurodeles waltl TaxID=8319 RepID=A0AAV7VUK4_PLEWA|nr:hypothetical protein NDU88_007475 [Pleurodeles waltl]